MKNTINKLDINNKTISIVESMTGGLLSYEFSKHAGASKVFKGSIVAYSNEVKMNILNISKDMINKYTTVSEEVAYLMLKGLKNIIDSDVYISVTGNAGPSYEENTNEYKCYIKLYYNNEIYDGMLFFEDAEREKNIKDTVNLIKDMLELYIK